MMKSCSLKLGVPADTCTASDGSEPFRKNFEQALNHSHASVPTSWLTSLDILGFRKHGAFPSNVQSACPQEQLGEASSSVPS